MMLDNRFLGEWRDQYDVGQQVTRRVEGSIRGNHTREARIRG